MAELRVALRVDSAQRRTNGRTYPAHNVLAEDSSAKPRQKHTPRYLRSQRIAELVRWYQKDPNQERMGILVYELRPEVRAVAYKVIAGLPPNVTLEELISSGNVGLMDAITRCDLTRTRNVLGYLEIRIRGAMIDELRAADWVPRSMRTRQRKIDEAQRTLKNEGQEVTEEALAALTGLTIEQVYAVRAAPLQTSLEELGAQEREYAQFIGEEYTEQDLERGRFRHITAEIIDELSPRERIICMLYFFGELNLREIGVLFNVTESRVSQMLSPCKRYLVKRLREEYGGPRDYDLVAPQGSHGYAAEINDSDEPLRRELIVRAQENLKAKGFVGIEVETILSIKE